MPWFKVIFTKELEVNVEADSLEAVEKAAKVEARNPEPLGFFDEDWFVNAGPRRDGSPTKQTEYDFKVIDGKLKSLT